MFGFAEPKFAMLHARGQKDKTNSAYKLQTN